jgi:hypothetical protein
VNSAIAVCEGLDKIGGDKIEFRRFVRALADSKVMSQKEAAKPKLEDMSTLSKIRKIYEHRDIILHQSVADKLCTGYSVLYELGLLIDHFMPKGEVTDEVVTNVSDQLRKLLEKLDGDLTRQWIKGVRKSVGAIPTREKKASSDKPAKEKGPATKPEPKSEGDPDQRDQDESDDDDTNEGVDDDATLDDEEASPADV